MNGFPWLTVAGAVPLAGALVIALIPGLPPDSAAADRQARDALAKWTALAFSLLTLVVVIIIAVKFQVGGPNYQFTEIYSWIRSSACTTRSAWTASPWCSSPCPPC